MESAYEFLPIADRSGMSGGIESLMWNGERHYFGYDPGGKLILSSLFKDPGDMAAFASMQMRHNGKALDIQEWRERVDMADTRSSLSDTPVELTTNDLFKLAMLLRLACEAGQSASVSVSEPAIMLLRAACGDAPDGTLDAMFMMSTMFEDEPAEPASGDAVNWALGVVYGGSPVPIGMSFRQVGRALQRYLNRLARVAPGNWREVFSELALADDYAMVDETVPTPEQVTASLSSHCPFQVRGYAEVFEQVPEESAVYWMEPCEVEPEENLVLYVEGDLRLDQLNLDDPLVPWRQGEDGAVRPWFILVTGNLIVEQHMWSLETDGACGLIVLGDLTARNAIVGGQQIFVGGNLRIAELYWGDYNHGCLYVQGDVRAALLVQTDYEMVLNGEVSCLKRLNDLDALDGEDLKRIIAPECVIQTEPEPVAVWQLDASTMLTLLEAGRHVISMEALAKGAAPFRAPSIFSDATIGPENFLRLGAGDLMPLAKVETWMYQFARDGLQLTVLVSPPGKGGTEDRSIIMEDMDRGLAVCFSMVRQALPRTWIDRLLFRPKKYGWALLKAICDDFRADEPDWSGVVGESFSPEFTDLVLQGWAFLLEGASSRHWAAGQIAPAEVRTLLALPVAAPYDDYDSDDRNGFWLGSLYASFQRDDKEDGSTQPTFRLTRAYLDNLGETKHEHYYYEIERCLDEQERVRIRYLADQDSEEAPVALDLMGGQRLDDAVRLFRRGAAQLQVINTALLEGVPPPLAEDDDFAMDYWRGLGLI
ncbi:hypothetical protein ACV4V9_24070 [Pseudomonas aeruginosa]